jgi:tetratricopeptide (TPR) repeat protein
MKMKIFTNGVLLMALVLVHLYFTACTKSNKVVHTPPDTSGHVKEDMVEKSSVIQEETERLPKKDEPGEPKPTIKTESPHVIMPQPRLRITTKEKSIILDAGESHKIVVCLENQGNAAGKNVNIDISEFTGKGILKSDETLSKSIDVILPGQKKKVVFPVEINPGIEDTTLTLKISINKGTDDSPSILKIKAICRSEESVLYDEIKKKRRITKCLEYLEKYGNGSHNTKVKNLLEDLRWDKAQRIYKQAAAKGNAGRETIAGIEDTYLVHYGPEGRYSNDAAMMCSELRDFQNACAVDTCEGYRKFKEKYKKSPFSQVAKHRITLNYWKQREKKDHGNPHIWCQVAQALVEEKGDVGYREAKEYFVKTIQKRPNKKEAYIGIGKILTAWRNYEECLEYLVSKRPKEIRHYKIDYYVGYAYEQLENNDKAISYYSRAIKNLEDGINTIDSQEKQSDYLACLYYRALLYRISLYIRKAKKDFEKIIELAPESQRATDAKIYLKEI